MASADTTLEELASARFVPVVRATTAEKALAAARALAAGGCRVIEVTLTVSGALETLRALVRDGLTVGAGTVLTPEEARAVYAAGASFIVSPHCDPAIVALAAEHGMLAIPGALTPGEVVAARRTGAPVVKIFPAESVGGPRYLKLLRDPLPDARFFPTGGVTLANAADYLANGAVAVGVGTALLPRQAVEDGDLTRLETEARRWCEALH